MNFNDTEQQAEFRARCSAWLKDNAQPKTSARNDKRYGKTDQKEFLKSALEWQKKKFDAGWAMLHWPKIYGGLEASPIERIIWGQEEAKFDVPWGVYEIGLGMAGPVMMQYATEEQKQRYLPPMPLAKKSGANYFLNPLRDQMWPVCAAEQCRMAMIGSSMVRKSGHLGHISVITALLLSAMIPMLINTQG